MPPRYNRLSVVYFFYFSVFGIYLPYWALYLRDLGMSSAQVGELLAIVIGTKLFAPYLWGWIADHTRSRLILIKIAALLGFVFFSLILFNPNFVMFAVLLFLFSFFWNSMLPQIEVITLNSLRYESRHYSLIRLWGSVGFIVCATGFASAIEYWGSHIVPWLIAGLLFVLWMSTIRVKHDQRFSIDKTVSASILPYLKKPEIICLLIICFLLQMSHGAYYGFFSIYMRENGYTDFVIGQLWSLGVIAEIAIFIMMPRLLKHWGAPTLLTITILITSMRWVLIALFPQQLGVLLFAQCLHAVSFGAYHAAAISLIALWFSSALQGRGQALYAGVSFGLGGAIGSYLAGSLWDQWGGSSNFIFAAFAAAIAILFTMPLYKAYTR